MNQRINSKADLKKWRTELPNLYDDADLDPFEFRLLVHYVRVGDCYESTKTTAEHCHMSTGQVSEKRKSLAAKGWIVLGESDYDTVSIDVVDKWQENFATFSEKAEARSLSESARSPHERSRSPRETKKEPVEERTNKEESVAKTATPLPPVNYRFPPSVLVFKEETGCYPPQSWRDVLDSDIGSRPDDLDFWRQVVHCYIGTYPNKSNVQAMLEFYKRHELPGTSRIARSQNTTGKPAREEAKLDDLLANRERNRKFIEAQGMAA